MPQKRWIRIIPIALIMYTISYVDRTNVSLALDPTISSMMRDLLMDDRMKGAAAGIFFIGYVILQLPGGYIAQRWSPKKLISICLVVWGLCAMACGFARTFHQFEVARFLLGFAESSVFPAATILVNSWFPQSERVRANAAWYLCQPLAVIVSAPVTGWCLGAYGWRAMLVMEGALPILWLPFWWFCISDRPREAKWISVEERDFLEAELHREMLSLQPDKPVSLLRGLCRWQVLNMIAICMLYSSAAYACMTFFTTGLKERNFSPLQYGILFAIPYVLAAVIMILNAWHSDKTRERRGHVAGILAMSGICLILSVVCHGHFWLSYGFLCFAIPGPFAALAPFWAIPSETLPRPLLGATVGLVNAIGNLGGFVGPYFVGGLKDLYHSVAIPFASLGGGLILAACLCFLLPKSRKPVAAVPVPIGG